MGTRRSWARRWLRPPKLRTASVALRLRSASGRGDPPRLTRAPPRPTGRGAAAGDGTGRRSRAADPLRRLHSAQRTAEEFLADLAPAIALRALVMTPQSAFGHGRGGTVERMREHGSAAGFDVRVVDPVVIDGEPVSSSRLRQAVADGDLEAVARLGWPAYLQGTVVEGDHRGRELGYPDRQPAHSTTPRPCPRWASTPGVSACRNAAWGRGIPRWSASARDPPSTTRASCWSRSTCSTTTGTCTAPGLSLSCSIGSARSVVSRSADELVAQMHRDEADARARLGLG